MGFRAKTQRKRKVLWGLVCCVAAVRAQPLLVVVGGEAKAVEEATRAAVKGRPAYLAGAGASSAAVFYLAARVPELWAAALAVEGSPKAAVDTGRLYAANTQLVPVLWVSSAKAAPGLEGYNLERRGPGETKVGQALEWLAGHQRDESPAKVDCETGNPELARC